MGNILNKSAGIILVPLYTRYFTLEEYGTLSILLLVLQLGSFISLLGISSAAMRFYFDYTNEIDRKALYGTALFMVIILPIIVCTFGFAMLYYGHDIFFSSIPFFPHLLIILFLSALAPLIKLYIGLLRVREAAVSYIIFNFLFVLSQFVFIIVAVKYLSLGLRGQLKALLASYILFWLISLLLFLKEVRISFSFRLAKKILAFALPLVPSFFLIWGLSSAGRFALERFASLADVGLFSLAAQFSGILGLIAESVDNALLPYFYQIAGTKKSASRIAGLANKFIALFSIAALLILVFATSTINILADSKFHTAVNFIPLLVFVTWVRIIYKIFHWNLMFHKKTKMISLLLALSVIILVGCLLVFVDKLSYGIYGVIIAMMISNITLVGAAYFLSQRYLHVQFMYKKLGAIVLLMLLTGVFIILAEKIETSMFVLTSLKLVLFIIGSLSILKSACIDDSKTKSLAKVMLRSRYNFIRTFYDK